MILNKYNWFNYTNYTMADVPSDYIDQEMINLTPLQIRTFMVTFSDDVAEEDVEVSLQVKSFLPNEKVDFEIRDE